ncbi:GNAT family N-acetyltransferase [Noviherbaspirillum sp. ST9]|uniref:GNAT family N-acetyltransferase n=1 Tax=Noviherbaspirillum sp. ST9 TaxID=3401606 RepID=UPI003B586175
MPIEIRSEAASDIADIEALTTNAFLHAPHTSHTEQFIVNALRKAGQLAISLVATDGGAIVGHVAVSPVSISSGAGGWYGIGPVSVLPERQGKGIGSALVSRALDDLHMAGAAGCVVLGEPGYYARFGFRAEPALVLPGVPQEYFQTLSFNGSVPSGTVSYDEAFNATY